ncbi:hypothetical protein [Hydrogenophaga sp.]
MNRKRIRVYSASIRSKRRLHLDQQHPPPTQQVDETDVLASLESEVPIALERRPSPELATVYLSVQQKIYSERDQVGARGAMTAVTIHLVEGLDEMKPTEVPRNKSEAIAFFKKLLFVAATIYAKDGMDAASSILKKMLSTFDGD